MTDRLKKFKQDLYRKMLVTILRTLVISFVTAAVFMFAARLLFSQYTWQYGTPYLFLHFINENKGWVLLLLSCICVIFVVVRSWKQLLGYLNDTVEAAEIASRTDDQPIVLSAEMKEVQYLLNDIKANVKANEQAAKEAEQRKNDLIVYLAHDLKTPLTSVIGYLTLLRDEGQISPELQEKYLSISLEKAERLEDLINEFFEITKFQLTTISLEYGQVNLTRMLEQITYEFAPMLAPKQLTCNLIADPNIFITCDGDKIQRVFDNLLRNAVNYSYENSEIKIEVLEDEHSVQCQFTNHGATIPREKLDRIFEQFYRLDTARTTKTGGAGLGLAIAKEIVEKHNGSIGANSANETIRFVVILPK